MTMTSGLRRLCKAGKRAAEDACVSVCVYLGEDGVTPLLQNTREPSDWDGDLALPEWEELKRLAGACGVAVSDTERLEFFPTGPIEVHCVEFIKLPPHTAPLFNFVPRSRSPTLSLSPSEPLG